MIFISTHLDFAKGHADFCTHNVKRTIILSLWPMWTEVIMYFPTFIVEFTLMSLNNYWILFGQLPDDGVQGTQGTCVLYTYCFTGDQQAL